MKEYFVEVENVSIAVTESDGPGLPLVLVHGNSCSRRTWAKQLEGQLGSRHRLIAFDLPGHGDSSRAPDPEQTYHLPGYAAVLVRLAERLELGDALFVGWSLGGHVVLEAADRLSRAAGFAIFGTPPLSLPVVFAGSFLPNPAIAAAFRGVSSEAEVEALLRSFVKPGASPAAFMFEDFKKTDPKAREVLAASLPANRCQDEVAIVRALKRPLAIFHGEDEQVVNRRHFDGLAMPTLWRGAVQDMTGAGHAPHWEAPSVFNALVEDFARDCGRSA